MSLKSHLLTGGKATGTGVLGQKKRMTKAKVFSTYNLCTLSSEEVVAQFASTYSLSTAPT